MFRSVDEKSSVTDAGFLFVIKECKLRNCCHNAEDGQKDKLVVEVISCMFLNTNKQSSAILLLILLCLCNVIAKAHTGGVSKGNYQLINTGQQTSIETELFFARQELDSFIFLDTDTNGIITETELSAKYLNIQTSIIDHLEMDTPAGRCIGKLNNTRLVESDGIKISAKFLCPEKTNKATINIQFLANLARGHRHVITAAIDDEKSSYNVAYTGKSNFQLMSSMKEGNKSIQSFFVFGLEHILTGFDHLLFVFGLIIMPIGLKQVLFAVTAFTVAHSITLGLSVLGILVPSAGFIEPLIALSIAYVGIENSFANNLDKRWMLTFVFGLIHGFGFAGALQNISLSGDQIPWVLLNFNLGVESGQVVVIILSLPLLYWLRKKCWFNYPGIAILNTGLVILGSYWFLDRSNLFLL